MAFGDLVRKVLYKMFPKKTVEGKLNVQIATSAAMDRAVELWLQMYANHPPWEGGANEVSPLNLPATIAEEMARLTLTEFSLELTGSPRAEYIFQQLTNYLESMSNVVERWAALGGIALKPYVSGDTNSNNTPEICIDITPASRFYPTAFNSNQEVTGAVFVDSKHVGDYIFTRLEHHSLNGTTYTVTNKAFRSERLSTVGAETDVMTCSYPFLQEVPLSSVDDWASLEPEVTLLNISAPLFVYVKIPRANNVDPESPLGASVYSRAVETIQKADEQYSRTLWEYESFQAAVFAEKSLFKKEKRGGVHLPEGSERLFRVFEHESVPGKEPLLKEFAPNIRDVSMFNGLNELLRRIETQCGLAFGTLSNVTDTEKTATEIKMSKQRSYTTIHAMQTAWEYGIDRLIQAMDTLCTLYHLAPAGNIEKTCTWGDGVLEDTDLEYTRRMSMVSAGLLREETFLAWYFGCSEEEAREKYLPSAEPTEEDRILDETEE